MVILLAQTLLSCAKFRPLRVIKKRNNPADTGLWSNEGMFQAFAMVWQTAQNGRLPQTGEPTIWAVCTPQTVLDRHFWCLFCFFKILLFFIFYQYSSIFVTGPTKACLLCVTPAGTYRVQSPGFPKTVCCQDQQWNDVKIVLTSLPY